MPAAFPRPGTTVSERRRQLENDDGLGVRFIDVRNLAYMEYKKPDGTPLMTYQDTLDDRGAVKVAVLNHEIAIGSLVLDGTEGQLPAAIPSAQPEAAPQGAPQMTMPFPQPNGTNGAQQAPQYAQPQQPQFQPGVPPVASPAQAAGMMPQQMPQMALPPQAQQAGPPQQEAPTAAPTGRKRGRGAAAGTAVAPPPTAPPQQQYAPQPGVPVQQFPQPPQQPQYAPQAPQFAPQAGPPQFQPQQQQAAPGFAPVQVPQQQFAPAPQMAPPQQALQAGPTPGIDLTPLLQRLDAIGKQNDLLVQKISSLEQQVSKLTNFGLQTLTVLHHMYLSNPALAAGAAGKNTLPEFQGYLQQFIGTPS